MAKLDLQKIADDFFKRYRKADKVFITTDGQPFTDENYAKTHAQAKDLDVETFRRNGEDSKEYDLDEMDRVQLEAFIKDNGLEVIFYAETPDEDLRTMVENAIEKVAEAAKAKKTTSKKAKK
ncbi:hypothetical protein GGR21_000771 [Dysgonomonas hofstadii]|uniref:Uncharacterized protein n=1 Tax=Dysgonomonas hofstadii TaxID=637886 RepID=A0A840CMY5_9BACT|nr:hypothetical protein [Dysgonomonas hofstadii]MBB4034884.1 hypothetical protein [Dysgonomonas hofstadii]